MGSFILKLSKSCGSNFQLTKTFPLPTTVILPTGTISLYIYKLYLLAPRRSGLGFLLSFSSGCWVLSLTPTTPLQAPAQRCSSSPGSPAPTQHLSARPLGPWPNPSSDTCEGVFVSARQFHLGRGSLTEREGPTFAPASSPASGLVWRSNGPLHADGSTSPAST